MVSKEIIKKLSTDWMTISLIFGTIIIEIGKIIYFYKFFSDSLEKLSTFFLFWPVNSINSVFIRLEGNFIFSYSQVMHNLFTCICGFSTVSE